jgi:hypothetical protein
MSDEEVQAWWKSLRKGSIDAENAYTGGPEKDTKPPAIAQRMKDLTGTALNRNSPALAEMVNVVDGTACQKWIDANKSTIPALDHVFTWLKECPEFLTELVHTVAAIPVEHREKLLKAIAKVK